MSTAHFSEDHKEICIECNCGKKAVFVTLKHLDRNTGVPTDNDRIMLKYDIRDRTDMDSQLYVSNHVIIKKEHTAVLSHVFRSVSDVMDEWYGKPDMMFGGKMRRWVPGHYEDVE